MTDERPTGKTTLTAATGDAASDGRPRFFDLYREPVGITPLSDDERAVLRMVNQRVSALPTLDDVIDLLFERTAGIFPFDRIGLSFVEEDGRLVVSRYVRAAYDKVLLAKGYSQDLRDSSLERVLRQGTPRIIDDLESYLREHPGSRSTKLLLREGVRSSLTCPLIVEGRIVGFMFRSSRLPHAYTQHHVELQMALTERLSQAVEKAWRIEQLTAANRNYLEMLGFVSHELKNPVASMVTDARLLADGYLGPVEERQKVKLERLITKGEYLLDLVREYLDLARVEGGELQVAVQCDVPFVEKVVEPAIELVRAQIEAAGMALTTELPDDHDFAVDCDPSLLIIVLVNLLSNAVHYGAPGGALRLTVAPSTRRLRVTVWNEGPGFSPAERARLFRKFSRLHTPSAGQRRGTGLGLYNSWRIVQLHHGHIKADAAVGAWAEFTFELPQPLCPADVADERTERTQAPTDQGQKPTDHMQERTDHTQDRTHTPRKDAQMTESHKILAVHITDRMKDAAAVQKVFTEFGCNIKTRVGLHDVAGDVCAPGGVVLLELVGPATITADIAGALGAIAGVEVQKVEFAHAG